jgi:transposase
MVKKLLQQRRHTGSIAPRHHWAGRKPTILAVHQNQMRTLLAKKNDLTLRELRQATGLKCSVQAIHVALAKLGLTCKKRPSAPAKQSAPIWSGRVKPGSGGRKASIRRG